MGSLKKVARSCEMIYAAPVPSVEGETLAAVRSYQGRDVTILNKVDKSYIGHIRPPSTVKVEAAQCCAFVNAIGEVNPIYRDVDAARGAGLRALPTPPTYLFCLQMMSLEESRCGVPGTGHRHRSPAAWRAGIQIPVADPCWRRADVSPRILDVQDKKGRSNDPHRSRDQGRKRRGIPVTDLHQTTVMRN